jgi:hypothetical protein
MLCQSTRKKKKKKLNTEDYRMNSESTWILDFSKINNISGLKASLNKYDKTETTPCILSDHNGIKLELNNKGNGRKYFKHLETEQHVAP